MKGQAMTLCKVKRIRCVPCVDAKGIGRQRYIGCGVFVVVRAENS